MVEKSFSTHCILMSSVWCICKCTYIHILYIIIYCTLLIIAALLIVRSSLSLSLQSSVATIAFAPNASKSSCCLPHPPSCKFLSLPSSWVAAHAQNGSLFQHYRCIWFDSSFCTCLYLQQENQWIQTIAVPQQTTLSNSYTDQVAITEQEILESAFPHWHTTAAAAAQASEPNSGSVAFKKKRTG